jgi:putative RNA 2'-phosphotransferase
MHASKFLARHLRHAPHEIGLALGPGGWVPVDELLAACARHGLALSFDDLTKLVRDSDKQRFAFDETGTRIRANQGHTVEVDLELAAATPPDRLFHGTAARHLEVILREGLKPMGRHHVHLSADAETAHEVGRRHGKPVVLHVDAAAMAAADHRFYRSANGVWLTDAVPPGFLRRN